MNRNDGLDFYSAPGGITPRPSQTSYFSEPENFLDPRLFEGTKMHPEVRQELSDTLMSHLSTHYSKPELWAKAWLAGSGASYQWSADRDPGDLDMLVGIDYPNFRMHNDRYVRLSDDEISQHITDCFRQHLTPKMKNWHDQYEVTWFSNPGSTDIRAIKPYAAYDVVNDKWDVEPDARPYRPDLDAHAEKDRQATLALLRRYNASRDALMNTGIIGPAREKHITTLTESLKQAQAMYKDIHEGRHDAFDRGGAGYADPANYRWQAGKRSGIVPALKALSDFMDEADAEQQVRHYGVQLPTIDALLLRSMVLSDDRTH